MSISKSTLSKKKSKSPTLKASLLNPWTSQSQNTKESTYCKNLDNIAKSLIQKMKTSVVLSTIPNKNKENLGVENSINYEEAEIQEK